MTFVDTNVLLDIADADPVWLPWSSENLEKAASRSVLVINDAVFAEMSGRFPSLSALERFVETLQLLHAPIPRVALFAAGKAFRAYRHAGGGKENVLPDFIIGSHALTLGLPLLTRDPRPYRTYFPKLELITP